MDAPAGIEVTMRVNKNGTFVFILNHGQDAYMTAMPFAGTDLLKEKSYEKGDTLTLDVKDVAIIKLLT